LQACRFSGHRAIVTGAGGGIGRAIAVALVDEGASVLLAGRRQEKLAETATLCDGTRGQAIPVVCDISEASDLASLEQRAAESFGGLDLLVSNAAIGVNAEFHDTPTKALDAIIATNIRGTYLTLQLGLRLMLTSGGCIVVIGSLGAQRPAPRASAYGMSKAATHAMARHAAIEYARRGIRVNVVAPGATDTDLLAAADDDVRTAMAESVPDGRIASTEEVAKLTLFLASDDAAHVTGQLWAIDGGASATISV
jgi:NAD(P)-dependent dehydrogenase (short-subunit alcohol dehydrogenase family)